MASGTERARNAFNSESGSITPCIFHNATREELNLFGNLYSFYGDVLESYPTSVENGHWGTFEHVNQPHVSSCSAGFVMYRVKCDDINYFIVLLGWDTLDQITKDNHAYCDILRDDGTTPNPDDVLKYMRAAGRQHVITYKGMRIEAEIEEGSYPLYKAILIRDDGFDAENSSA